MAVETEHWEFTVADFMRMGEAGIFSEDARVEFIDGAVRNIGYHSNKKMLRYAQVGIPECWVVDVNGEQIIQYADPDGASYQTENILELEDTIVFVRAPDLSLPVNKIL